MPIQGYYGFNGDSNDASGNGRNGTSTGVTYPSGKMDASILYPNTNNKYSTFGTVFNFTSEDFSFSFWLNVLSFTTSTAGQYPIPLYKGGYNSRGYYSQVTSTAIGLQTCQSSKTQSSSASITINTNVWNHYVFTRSGASVRIYVNGVDKTTSAGTHINPATSSEPFLINKYNLAAPNEMIGNIQVDEMIVDQKKWVPSEVKNKYSYYKGFF